MRDIYLAVIAAITICFCAVELRTCALADLEKNRMYVEQLRLERRK